MGLSKKDLRHLVYMERWAGYKMAENPLSMAEVIKKDCGNNFSSILLDEDMKVKSFSVKSVPQADFMLVLNNYPRVLAYTAEVAIRFRNAYGKLPELINISSGRGIECQSSKMAEWLEEGLLDLGFPEEWVKKHHLSEEVIDYADSAVKIDEIISKLELQGKPKVLVITGIADTLLAATELPILLPHIEFNFFEAPQLDPNARLFDDEVFAGNTYAIDNLLANVVMAQKAVTGRRIRLPVEKLMERPKQDYVRDLLLRGFAGAFNTPEMWKAVGLSYREGEKLYEKRIAELAKMAKQGRFEQQTERLMFRIKRSLNDKGLVY